MDHANHTRLTHDELTEAVLDGATVYGPGDETVGSVSHTHGMGASAKVVLDVGGFLGIGAKPVMVPATDLDFMRSVRDPACAAAASARHPARAARTARASISALPRMRPDP